MAETPRRRNQSSMEPALETSLNPRQQPAATVGSRLFLAAIGVSLMLIGSLFILLMGRSFLRARAQRSWPQVRCVILSSELEERRNDPASAPEFRQNLSYGYDYLGKAYTADHLTLRSNPWSSRKADLELRADKTPAGLITTCRVDPTNPKFAVLTPDSLAPAYAIWFPALFVIGGLGIAVQALRPRKR